MEIQARVRVLDPDYDGEIGSVLYVDINEGYPIVKVKLDSTGQSIYCFINEVEEI